jgi:hypothetical protein
LAKTLGYFSIALGVAELIAPRALSRAVGAARIRPLLRAYGAREIATGVAILASHDPEPWIWARVAGDVADIATVATGRSQNNARKENNALALASLAAVTIVDIICAGGLNSEKGGRKTASADYRDRSGFPQGIQAAKGAARGFRVPQEMTAQVAPVR